MGCSCVQILAFWVGVILLKCSKALQEDCSLKRQVSYATFVKFSKDKDTFENFFNKTFSECAAPSLLNQNISSSPESNVTNGGELHCPRSETIGIKTDGALKTIQVTKGENLERVYQRYREFYGECSDIHKNLLLENIFRSNLTTAFNYCPVDDFHVFHVGGTKVQFEVKQGDPIAPILATLCTEHRCCTKGCQRIAIDFILRSPRARKDSTDRYLLSKCGRWSLREDQHEHFRSGYMLSKVATFLAPLFPGVTLKDFFFPVNFKNDWVTDVVGACGVYEAGMTFILALALSPLNNASDTDLFLDVGAHMGWYSLVAAKICRVSRVLAFEPHPQTAYQNMQGLVKNSINSVELTPGALSESSCQNVFLPHEHYVNRGGINVFKREDNNSDYDSEFGEGAYSVMSTSLDHLNLTHIRLIKVDVNSHASHFLRGARNTIQRRGFDYMLIEILSLEDEHMITEIAHLLKSGYIVSCIDGLLADEAGVYFGHSDQQVNLLGKSLLEQYLSELKQMVYNKECNNKRIKVVRNNEGNHVVAQCVVGEGDRVLKFCSNMFVSKSEEDLAKIVELSKLAKA